MPATTSSRASSDNSSGGRAGRIRWTSLPVFSTTLTISPSRLFADAVHPTHEVRPAGCWAPKDAKVALEQTSGRQRLNIHGAIDLETGTTRMIEATTIDALSTIALLMAIAYRHATSW